MALRPAPKRKSIDYQKLDNLQKEIFGTEKEGSETPSEIKKREGGAAEQNKSQVQTHPGKSGKSVPKADETDIKPAWKKPAGGKPAVSQSGSSETDSSAAAGNNTPGAHLSDLEAIAAQIVSSKAGQGRSTTRPFSLPRTLIIDTTRLKSKFRTIDEQFTQNVIIDFLLREALKQVTPENYKDLRAAAFTFVKRAEETTRRSLTVTEEVIYQMSELKAGINLETGRKYSNDEIFSTLLALGVSWLYQNDVLT
jgi:hypothetical protein